MKFIIYVSMFSQKYIILYIAAINTVLSLYLIYFLSSDYPVPSKPGCYFYRNYEYCQHDLTHSCKSSFSCSVAYIAQAFSNLIWIFFGTAVLFSVFKIYTFANASYYRDVTINRCLARDNDIPV